MERHKILRVRRNGIAVIIGYPAGAGTVRDGIGIRAALDRLAAWLAALLDGWAVDLDLFFCRGLYGKYGDKACFVFTV